jgi:hypothetical protein
VSTQLNVVGWRKTERRETDRLRAKSLPANPNGLTSGVSELELENDPALAFLPPGWTTIIRVTAESMARSVTNIVVDADDLASEMLLEIWTKQDYLRQRPYALKATAANAAKDYINRERDQRLALTPLDYFNGTDREPAADIYGRWDEERNEQTRPDPRPRGGEIGSVLKLHGIPQPIDAGDYTKVGRIPVSDLYVAWLHLHPSDREILTEKYGTDGPARMSAAKRKALQRARDRMAYHLSANADLDHNGPGARTAEPNSRSQNRTRGYLTPGENYAA